MKICPNCGTRYTDDTLLYCLQDGSRLDPVIAEGENDERETVVRERGFPPAADIPSRRPRTGLIVAVTALLSIFLLSIGGIAAWLFFRYNRDTARYDQNNQPQNVSTPEKTPTATPAASPTTNANSSKPNANTGIDPASEAAAKREVTQFVANWRSATESRDINSYMSKYADSVAYYNKGSASREDVRKDKQRAFSLYDSINLDISNIETKIGPDGGSAVATFDKEWDFVGAKESRGKVRSELKLKKLTGEWRIVGERDLKVYYVE
jgi:ketosteroid isomerase-like protein